MMCLLLVMAASAKSKKQSGNPLFQGMYADPEVAVMGASGAVAILDGKEAKTKEDPKAFLAEKEKEYNDLFTNPYKAAEFGYVDDVIEPRNTRFRICRALAQLENKRETRPAKKHGNIPL